VTVVVGVDVGNSTTEAVLARVGTGAITVLGAAAAATRRAKGSAESLDGAAALVRRVERAAGVRAEVAVVAPLRPVQTSTVTLPEPAAATGRLRLVAVGAGTVGGSGWGVGRPVPLDRTEGDDRVVVVVPRGAGYAAALEPLRALLGSGRLAAVLLAEDEGVLLANRLGAALPVVDEVDPAGVLTAQRVAVEVAPAGGVLQRVADPLALSVDLGLSDVERADAARLVAQLRDASSAVVALDAAGARPAEAAGAWCRMRGATGGRPVPLGEAARLLRDLPVGAVSAYGLAAGPGGFAVDDLYAVDLAAVADTVVARAGAQRSRALALSVLRADAPFTDPAAAVAQRLGIDVRTVRSEAAAARAGALTTPGCGPATVVVDVGGGTVDVVSGDRDVVAAGAGELLTAGVAALTGATRAAAEWVKRGPAVRVEAPQLLLGEDGARQFLDRPASRETIGALAVQGPAGLLAFDRLHGPGEWRALRLRLKADVLGGNVSRALRSLESRPATVVVVGGPAGDDEALASVARVMPDGVAVGRGDVGGSLGHRYAVAYGLLVTWAGDVGRPAAWPRPG
jgi:hypothetical protein